MSPYLLSYKTFLSHMYHFCQIYFIKQLQMFENTIIGSDVYIVLLILCYY
jgi:hypothetical protein